MDPSHFTNLRDKLLHATEFKAVWEYFLDHISDDPELDAASHRTRSELLEPLFDQFCQAALNAKPEPGSLLLVRYSPAHFLHGGALVGQKIVNFRFFEDLTTGLFYVLDPLGRGPSQMARFVAREAPGTRPDQN